MKIIDVRDYVIVAAGINTGSGGVIELGHAVYDSQQIIILHPAVIVPGFVKGTPANDGRVVEVSLKNLHPFRKKIFKAGL